MGTITNFFISGQDTVLLVIRIIAGTTMIFYGLPKIRDLKANAEDFVGMGFKPGWFWGTIVALTESVGGLFIILGIWVPLAAVFFGFEMVLGAIWKITKTDKPFTDWSYDLLLLAVMLGLLLAGSGALALT